MLQQSERVSWSRRDPRRAQNDMRGSKGRVVLCLEMGMCNDLDQPGVFQEPGETVAPHVPEVPLPSRQLGFFV